MTHVREAILAQIKTELEKIADAGQAPAGRSWATSTTPVVYRMRKTAMTEPNFPSIAMFVAGNPGGRFSTGSGRNLYQKTLRIELLCMIRDHDDPDTELSKIEHDVELILGQDHTLSSTATNSTFTDGEPTVEVEDAPIHTTTLFFEAVYRYFEDDPSTLAS